MRAVTKFGVCVGVFVAALSAAPASAQDLSLGYQFQRFSGDGDSINAPLGINADVAYPVSGPLSVVGQFDWSRKSESETVFGTSVDATANFTAVGGGVRYAMASSSRLKPYLQALIGLMHTSFDSNVAGQSFFSESTNDALFQVGAGVTAPMGRVNLLGQIDYRRVFSDSGVNVLRVVAGVRIPLGQ